MYEALSLIKKKNSHLIFCPLLGSSLTNLISSFLDLIFTSMADAQHQVVEILVDGDHQKQMISTISAIQDHPLMEISESPGHLLLLKLWQREEDLFGRRIARKETRMDTLTREIFQLCLFFFAFHGFFFTILFTSSQNNSCQKWWIPMLVSLSTCCMMILLVQMKLCRYWKVYGQLQRERVENRALTRCIQELRMKGASFDLSKEPGNGKRMKSSSVEIKWKPVTWCCRYRITIWLVCVMGLAVPVCRFMLCA
ncbi:hypothetical protein L6452_40048 [Arctium lappa]|uniref:Uncharacterized protein n=1 Tax=Arctium lappa TaxID=4217 RepID=A0ACB8XUH2_ARCLA|nr:hypothetical protein L6452_40048 [Arctium lappa]